MKKVLVALLVASFLPAAAFAKKTTYVVTNHRLNYVKLVEVKAKVAEKRQMTHPKELDEVRMRAVLKSIKMSRRHILNKELDTQDAFNDASINFLAPAIVKALRQATPSEEIVFSFLMKEPFFIIRNDRINIGNLWVRDNELHLRFQKLYAKVTGDIDKKGNFGEAVEQSRGLRIDLDLAPGQLMDVDDPEELVIDLAYNFEADAGAVASTEAASKAKEGATIAAEKAKKKGKKETAKAEEAALSTEAQTTAAAAKTEGGDVKARLERLEELKKEKLITDREYKEKKKEILQGL